MTKTSNALLRADLSRVRAGPGSRPALAIAPAIGLALAPALLVLAAPAAAQDFAVLGANLLGKGFEGGGVAEDASGDFDGEIEFAAGSDTARLCYYLEYDGIDAATQAHIHQAGNGASGDDADPVTLDLPVPAAAGEEACTDAPATALRALVADPAGYYIDIHAPGHAEAALRGRFED